MTSQCDSRQLTLYQIQTQAPVGCHRIQLKAFKFKWDCPNNTVVAFVFQLGSDEQAAQSVLL